MAVVVSAPASAIISPRHPKFRCNAPRNGYVKLVDTKELADKGDLVGKIVGNQITEGHTLFIRTKFPMYQNEWLNYIREDVIAECGVDVLILKGNAPTGTRATLFMFVKADVGDAAIAVALELIHRNLDGWTREMERRAEHVPRGGMPLDQMLAAPDQRQAVGPGY